MIPRNQEIWCGQTEGKILVLDYKDLAKNGQNVESNDIVNMHRNCQFLESAMVGDRQYVWSYNYPGLQHSFAKQSFLLIFHIILLTFTSINSNETMNCIDASQLHIFFNEYLGTTVSCWNVETKEVEAELNCADVVPITESGSLNAYFTNNLEGKIVINLYIYWIVLLDLILNILNLQVNIRTRVKTIGQIDNVISACVNNFF